MTQLPPKPAVASKTAPPQWIEISDFSPGIYDDFLNPGLAQPAPDGAAQLTGTFGCCSSSSGGLIPAPRSIKTFAENPATFSSPITPGFYPTNDTFPHIIGMRVMSPIRQGTIANFPPFTSYDVNADQHFIMYEWYFRSTGDGTNFVQRMKWKTHKFYVNPTSPGVFSLADLTTAATTNGKNGLVPHSGGTMDFSRGNPPSSTTPGPAIIGGVWANAVGDPATLASVYPANATPTVDSTDAIGGIVASTVPVKIVGHQDRFFYTAASVVQGFGTGGGLSNVEMMNATMPNDYTNSASTTGSVFVAENPTGITSMTSISASQLFCLKARGGGFTLSGAFEQPTITRLPGIASGAPPMQPSNIPGGGVVYGNQFGAWEWHGGDQTQKISPQLDGTFWMDSHTAQYEGYRARWAYSRDYVFVSNNFLYDLKSKSWWRLNNPATNVIHSFFDSTASGQMVASPAIVNPANFIVYEWFDPLQGASSYQWTSQPFQRSKDRQLELNEFVLVTSGAGTFTATISSSLPDSRQPQILGPITTTASEKITRIPCGFNAYDFVVQLNVAAPAFTTQPAPRIWRMALSFTPGNENPAS